MESQQQQKPDITTFQILETTLYTPDQGVALLDAHLARMKQSAQAIADAYAAPHVFPVGDACTAAGVVAQVTAKLGDSADVPHRVRLLLGHDGRLDVQVAAEKEASGPARLVLDRRATDGASVFVQCKTTFRPMYAAAAARLGAEHEGAHVLLYNGRGEITEAHIANVAVSVVQPDGSVALVTPPLSAGLLAGTMRARLLAAGRMVEGTVTVAQFAQAASRGLPVYCMNSVRGLYQVTPVVPSGAID
ncbi:hypothetical protein GGI04_005214 [Coemansia thaxteri]|uniref:Branched-chain-amino-acid aminotransferase n=1 Tax=Coemansia thaxteri TaxID=2663907 RepID=A0A9W8BFG4_9FUNG|nr:hypothetical protein GGI04_005214 [Coemansia thaxteri]KAJ1998956.1 hypothetical protein H4R26_005256 [Coemansia thaxteri]KAJ2463200.1 hypothetical protein GGI02_005291 [Coemansia sp. RSA 2322]